MMNPKELINGQILQAGEACPVSPDVVNLLKRRITPESDVPPMEYLFRIFNTPCFPRGELVAVAGKAKSGKTFFTSMLMAACLTPKVLALERFGHTDSTDSTERLREINGHTETTESTERLREINGHTDSTDSTDRASPNSANTEKICEIKKICVTKTKPLRVMWYDTEQSEQSTQDILTNRILPMVKGHTDNTDRTSPDSTDPEKFCKISEICVTNNPVCVPNNIFAFNVRCESWKSRLSMFAAGIAYLQPDLVVLDGVRDLISDINDGVEAQRITEQLMTLAQQHHCCIVCVLHQNKSDSDRNLRGWIGTELTNKVFEVYSCEKLKERCLFKVEQTHTRKYDIGRELYYTVDRETGLPIACDRPVEQPRDAQGRWVKIVEGDLKSPTDGEKWQSLNPTYIIRHPEGTTPAWEWNLRRLFSDALGGKDCLPYGTLMGIALGLSHISDKQVYYNAYKQAIEQGIIIERKHPATGQQLVSLAGGRLQFEDLPF